MAKKDAERRRRDRLLRRLRESVIGSEPIAADDIPEWMLGQRELVARAKALRANADAFVAWRLGWAAEHMRGKERGRWLDEAISAFARIAGTPIGPGNDDGPFCDIAPLLDLRQAQRACSVVARMERAGGWGDELGAAKAALAARLFTLGDQRGAAEILTGLALEDQAFVARLIVGPSRRRPRESLSGASVDDVASWTVRQCEQRLLRWLSLRGARTRRSDLLTWPIVLAVKRAGGESAVAALRRLVIDDS